MVDAQDVIAALQSQQCTLAVAESCTGGLLGASLTEIPGASAVFLGGVIAYGDEAKHRILDVPEDKLANLGAVSGAGVEAMAHAARDRFQTDMAVAVSGIAGPTGARPGKPVGTVWIATLGPGHLMDVRRLHLDGDRDAIRRGSVAACLEMCMESLLEAERAGAESAP
ncbi:MAG: CinA family protein [Thermoplasmatota archaeon]